jgi:hypothetical protein
MNNDQSIIWNQNALTMWAQVVNHMHALLFLLMHFIIGGHPHGEKNKSYFICNTKCFHKTFN